MNSQAAGIGRIVSFGNRCAWNNLGRNVVFADANLHPMAIFGDTLFPEDDEASQFDLDIHAIVELGDTGQIAIVNHLGSVRIFDAPWTLRPGPVVGHYLREARRLDYLEDVERVIGLGGRLVTSRPRSRRLGGVLVSLPITSSPGRLDADTEQESFGFVTALASGSTPDGHGWVALGGEGRVRLVEADHGRLGATRWEAPVDFLTAALVAWGSSLWAAGSATGGAGLDDYDWDRLGGGGLAQIDLASGDVVASARFGADLAWGSGGVALVVVDGIPCGLGRRGELHTLVPGEPETTQLTAGLAPQPLGIAHVAVVGDQLVIGFNRGGYRLHRVPLATISRLLRDRPARRA
ncbi:MAG TPA: hypothetical protein VG014_06895 [Acidimicrobiales bacterium]|nr:hypothetical protein [Acidimicrobiales bacterium]